MERSSSPGVCEGGAGEADNGGTRGDVQTAAHSEVEKVCEGGAGEADKGGTKADETAAACEVEKDTGEQSEPQPPAGVEIHLPDECLLQVMVYLPFKVRKMAQRVSKQWLRVGRQFQVLDVRDFLGRPAGAMVNKFYFVSPFAPFRLEEFRDTLSKTNGSVRRLNLVGLSSEDISKIRDDIKLHCVGVKHLEVEGDRYHDKIQEPYEQQLGERQPGQQVVRVVLDEQSNNPHAVSDVCSVTCLPNLKKLVLHECHCLNDATIKKLAQETLPHLIQLELFWDERWNQVIYVPEVRRAQRITWEEFFMALPKRLQHLKVHKWGKECPFLSFLGKRLTEGEPLPQLSSLDLEVRGVRNENIKNPLCVVCANRPQHSSLKLLVHAAKPEDRTPATTPGHLGWWLSARRKSYITTENCLAWLRCRQDHN